MSTNGRKVDTQAGRYLQHLLRQWLAADASRSEADFVRASGLSAGTVNIVRNKGEGAGPKTLEGFAKVFGRPVWQLRREAESWERGGDSESQAPALSWRFGDLPGWNEAEDEARERWGQEIPGYAFERARNTSGGAKPDVTPWAVAEIARFWLTNASRKERMGAEIDELDAQMAKKDAAAGRPARAPRHPRLPDTPPPPSAKPLKKAK